ncbi:MAG: DNA-3-methyladenine glycosylase 2 family protein [Euryarchaeota archaeon]|nr:DNA-3-methyladenine glycosylase 2 family protein [Euryarchaeota archaeon]
MAEANDPIAALVPKACRRWSRTDPVLAHLAKRYPLPPSPLVEPDGFRSLVSSIIHQQVSLAAGRAIHERLRRALGGRISPTGILRVGEEALRAAGLSRSKAAYITDLAGRTKRKEIDFRSLHALPDDAVVDILTQVKGIGTWTAKMFLMFHLHRPDVCAPEDLGLRLAVVRFYDVPEQEAWAFMEENHQRWSPYATVAARVLWNARRAVDEDT